MDEGGGPEARLPGSGPATGEPEPSGSLPPAASGRREFLKNAVATVGAAAGCALLGGAGAGPAAGATTGIVRPPGALPESEFLARCIRCLRCVEACPNQAILPLDASAGKARASTPAIRARRQACMLCNKQEGDWLKCTEACPSGALQKVRRDADEIREKVTMGTAVLDTSLCYSYIGWTCGACYRACPFPQKAMTLGLWERPTIVSEACVGCGLCARVCIRYPQAIRIVPREEDRWRV
ncbi:MAG: 4Fe-4S dicluster domain-containing protein [Candidatus Wallbacteria bacterium]|nr:4Fe-4S dicluster domain-containing protein [Candidatus Wallbacteria bacterium]